MMASAATGISENRESNVTRFRRQLQCFGLIGIIFSLILIYHHTAVMRDLQVDPSICSINATFDCDKVAKSAYSSVFGVPVASYALLYYLILFAFASLAGRLTPRQTVSLGALWALLGLVPSLIYLGIGALIIKSICLWCAVLYFNSIGLALAAFLALPPESRNLGALVEGVRALLSLLSHRNAIFFLAGILGFALFTIKMPDLFVTYLLAPQKSARDLALQNQTVLARWRASPEVDVNVVESGPGKDFTLGNKSAPIHLIEFSDYECPFCKRAAKMLHGILKDYPGQIYFVLKDYPLDMSCNKNMKQAAHQFACKAASIARCAGELKDDESFWRTSQALFATERFSAEALQKIMASTGTASEQLQSCMDSAEVKAAIERQIDEGTAIGVTGTPAIFINKRRIAAPREDEIRAIIQGLLSSQAKQR